MELKNVEATVAKMKDDLEKMKAETKPDDVIPAAVLFVLLDNIVPAMEYMALELKTYKEKE